MILINIPLIILFMCTLPSMASVSDCGKWGCFFTSPSILFPPLPAPITINASSTCHLTCIKDAACLGFKMESKTRRCQFIECEEEGKVSISSSKDSANLMWTLDMNGEGDRPFLRYFGSSDWNEKTLTDPSFIQSTIETAKKHCKGIPSKTP